jgi:hypothetical protein
MNTPVRAGSPGQGARLSRIPTILLAASSATAANQTIEAGDEPAIQDGHGFANDFEFS